MGAVQEELSSSAHVRYVLERVEHEVSRLYSDIPEAIRLKETELASEERRLANFVDFIGEGRGSRSLGQAVIESERRVEALREELAGLRRSYKRVFQTPPVEWIEERLGGLKEILERRTEQSGLLLRKLLGPIRLEPTQGDIGRPYYLARTSLNILAIMEPPPTEGGGSDHGSNSLRWWRRRESNPFVPKTLT